MTGDKKPKLSKKQINFQKAKIVPKVDQCFIRTSNPNRYRSR